MRSSCTSAERQLLWVQYLILGLLCLLVAWRGVLHFPCFPSSELTIEQRTDVVSHPDATLRLLLSLRATGAIQASQALKENKVPEVDR